MISPSYKAFTEEDSQLLMMSRFKNSWADGQSTTRFIRKRKREDDMIARARVFYILLFLRHWDMQAATSAHRRLCLILSCAPEGITGSIGISWTLIFQKCLLHACQRGAAPDDSKILDGRYFKEKDDIEAAIYEMPLLMLIGFHFTFYIYQCCKCITRWNLSTGALISQYIMDDIRACFSIYLSPCLPHY